MKFSLIICTYMRAEPLKILLDSVKTQLLYPNEIIIVDSSLNEETSLMISSEKYLNLKYFKVGDKDRGLTKQRNYGIDSIGVDSEIICFLDDDIILTPDYFKELIKTYSILPNALSVGGYITNEVNWINQEKLGADWFVKDGWSRNEGSRFKLRKKLGLLDNTEPGFMPSFSNGRSVSFLPPSGKIYEVEQIMGGVSSYRKEVFTSLGMTFSTYFEGYGLYEDADFSLRLAKKGKLYINTKAKLEHHHAPSGRPNQFKYGKMVTRNGWYVWRVKYKKPSLVARIQWNGIALVLTLLRLINVVTTSDRKQAFTEFLGRVYGWGSLIFNKPKISY